jgi:hypothetical protein
MTEKKITAQQIRTKLWKLQSELHNCIGANYLTSKYRIKVSYMLMWLRLIPVKGDYLKGWVLPDASTIQSYQEAAKGAYGLAAASSNKSKQAPRKSLYGEDKEWRDAVDKKERR